MSKDTTHSGKQAGFLDGQLLIAMPHIGDPRFDRALIYLCSHSAEGAVGLVINKTLPGFTFSSLFEQLGIKPDPQMKERTTDFPVHFGGPVEPHRGFVLHTQDYFAHDASLSISSTIAMTATLDIVRALASGHGPDHALLALGYAGWSPGQLENEIQTNGWLNCEPDEKILFEQDADKKYDHALKKLGIDLSLLSTEMGQA